ncbi:MAG: hypothetical protein GY873_14830 [Bosea sp.]|nr:hypothetical protein [Bosea sp. (in: a-proteobacteria)]
MPCGLRQTKSVAISAYLAVSVPYMVTFLVSFVSLIAACFIPVRRFSAVDKRGWALYSVAPRPRCPRARSGRHGESVPSRRLTCHHHARQKHRNAGGDRRADGMRF